jgi:hypothetical protein
MSIFPWLGMVFGWFMPKKPTILQCSKLLVIDNIYIYHVRDHGFHDFLSPFKHDVLDLNFWLCDHCNVLETNLLLVQSLGDPIAMCWKQTCY